MLRDRNSSAIVAVSDIARARRFYGETLGLQEGGSMEGEGVVAYRTGQTMLTVYESEYAGTNQANAVTWDAGGELDAIVADLKAKGVTFENYGDMDGMTFSDGVYSSGDAKLAWFKDPDGNILHLTQGM